MSQNIQNDDKTRTYNQEYSANLLYRIKGQIKIFPDVKKLKEFIITKQYYKKCHRVFIKKEKNSKNSNNKMIINIYLSTIMINSNGLSAPTKRHRVAKWIRK